MIQQGVLFFWSEDILGELTASGVHFEVDCALREDGGLAWFDLIEDESCSIFEEEPCLKGPVDGEVELGGSGVGVRSVESAWTEETNGHCYPITDDRREVG